MLPKVKKLLFSIVIVSALNISALIFIGISPLIAKDISILYYLIFISFLYTFLVLVFAGRIWALVFEGTELEKLDNQRKK